MRGYIYPKIRVTLLLAIFLVSFAGMCDKGQPKTVADALHSMGEVKRKARAAGEITPQQSADITRKLDAMNRSYRKFIDDEQARIAAGAPDPEAKANALKELRSLLNGVGDPAVLGIKSAGARSAWNGAVATLNTILAGFGG
jgi:hypothetical protein